MQFSLEEMIKFLQDFDYVKQKFIIDDDDKIDLVKYNQFLSKYNEMRGKYLNNWNVESINETYDIINTVYFNNNAYNQTNVISKKYIETIDLVYEKVIYGFLDIQGLDELFNSNFFKFEKMMHEEYMHNQKPYYRDHYIHQVRNMFEMIKLLDDTNFYEGCIKNQFKKSSDIGMYLQNLIDKEIREYTEDKSKLLKKIVDDDLYDKKFIDKVTDYHEFYQIYNKRYILYGSAMVAALCHDIGYIIGYMSRVGKTLSDFIPNSYLFFNSNYNLKVIHDTLRLSLLFNVIPVDEILDRIHNNDHGAISAIVLLMFFYNDGHLSDLTPLNKAVIELSALVIYNHTTKYEFQDLEERSQFQNIFVKGPISYLFRLCDDMQEWERTYYEINDKSNIFICFNCGMPMIKKDSSQKQIYYCGCYSNNSNSINYKGLGQSLNDFQYRRVMNAKVCTSVELNGDKNNRYELRINYSLIKLLELSYYNVSYARFRQKELVSLRRSTMLETDLPYIYVNGNISFNPIYLKCEILEQYLYGINEKLPYISLDFTNFIRYINATKKKKELNDYVSKEELKKNFDIIKNNKMISTDEILKYLLVTKISNNSKMLFNFRFDIYYFICLTGHALKSFISNNAEKFKNTELDKLDKYVYSIADMFAEETVKLFSITGDRDTVKYLIQDYYYQKICYVSYKCYCNTIRDLEENGLYNKKTKSKFKIIKNFYENMGRVKNDDIMVNKVESYTDYSVLTNDYRKMVFDNCINVTVLDFFSDFYLFYLMGAK